MCVRIAVYVYACVCPCMYVHTMCTSIGMHPGPFLPALQALPIDGTAPVLGGNHPVHGENPTASSPRSTEQDRRPFGFHIPYF